MKIILILSCIIAVQAGVIKEDEECNGVKINGVYYEREILYENLDRPSLLATDYSSNTLYFSYSVDPDDDEYKTAKLNLNTKEFGHIEGVNNGFAQTVDQKSQKIYIGGEYGIYIYDYSKNKVELILEEDTDVWTLFFKDVLYFTEYPSQLLYTYADGQVKRFPDLEDTKVHHFLIDNDNEMFFSNFTGLYSRTKGTKYTVLYEEFAEDGVRGISADTKGNVFVCLPDGIYSVNKSKVALEKVFDVDDAFGLAFDNENNFVYTDDNKLVRLIPNKNKTYC